MTTAVGKEPRELGKLALWEYGRKKLGYGDFDPDRDEFYGKWSGLESHKLFLVMRKRKISNDDFVICVDYCHRHHKRIENAVWVFRFLSEAKDEWRLTQAKVGLAADVEGALAYERALGDVDSKAWIYKLVRARGPYREEVMDLWRQARTSEYRTPV